jgi:hypothetical protein
MNDHAAHKVAEIKWRNNLDYSEREVVASAEQLNAVLPALGATYRAAFFLHHYLANLYAINGEIIVGFVNNGEDNIYRSHAWFLYENQPTDLAISRLGGVGSDQAGPLLIHGFEVKPGKKKWEYHRARPSGSVLAVQELVPDPEDTDAVRHAEELHMHLANVALNSSMVRAYLDQAPDKMDYMALTDLMKA